MRIGTAPVRWRGNEKQPSRLEGFPHILKNGFVILNVLHHIHGQDQVKGVFFTEMHKVSGSEKDMIGAERSEKSIGIAHLVGFHIHCQNVPQAGEAVKVVCVLAESGPGIKNVGLFPRGGVPSPYFTVNDLAFATARS